jgi:hypothetical protein
MKNLFFLSICAVFVFAACTNDDFLSSESKLIEVVNENNDQ